MLKVCPVVSTYTKYVQHYLEDEIFFAETYLHKLEEYVELINLQGDGNLVRQHQRAFLCIEMMLHFVACSIEVQEKQTAQYMQWERSSAGLSKLIAGMRGDHDDLTGASMEYVFARGMLNSIEEPDGLITVNRVGDGIEQMYHQNRHTLMEVYRFAGEAAVVLRRSLRNPGTPLTRVGRRLGLAAEVANTDTSKLFFMLEALLNQTEEHAPRAWELEL